MHHLLALTTSALDANHHHAKITESLLSLAGLWNLQSTLDIADLLVQTLIQMRVDLTKTHAGNTQA